MSFDTSEEQTELAFAADVVASVLPYGGIGACLNEATVLAGRLGSFVPGEDAVSSLARRVGLRTSKVGDWLRETTQACQAAIHGEVNPELQDRLCALSWAWGELPV